MDEALSGGRSKSDSRYRAERYQLFVRQWLADIPAIRLYQPKMDYISLANTESIGEDAELIYPVDRYANVIYWSGRSGPVLKTP